MENHVRVLILVLAAFIGGCASRRAVPPPPDAPPSAPAVAAPSLVDPVDLIRRGCFTCLERALDAARQQNMPQVAFEAATLLALRAKELGLPPDAWIEAARTNGAEDATSRLILEIVDAIPEDPLSGARDVVLTQTPRRLRAGALLPQWITTLQTGPGSLAFRSYLQLALSCASDSYGATKPEEIAASVPAPVRDLPLLQYRLGVCGRDHAAVLRLLRAADPEYVDADYALGRYAIQVRDYPDLDGALRLLQSAARAFPRSPAIATTAGNVHQMIEAWPDALSTYDAALALVPEHPDALLGRTISLSNLQQHEQAIVTATRLIDGRRWFLGQALYWRAWNHFQLGNYGVAREDADLTRQIMVNPSVYLLSGMIDWRLRRLEHAESEFGEALQMDYGQCEAATFLGGVRTERSKVPEAIAAFKQALQCYDLNITVRRAAIARLDAADATPAHKAREIGRHQRGIEQAEKRRAEALNGIDLLQKYLTSTQPPPRSPRP
jgi:tetratricopeptide (TPR) repeat protein